MEVGRGELFEGPDVRLFVARAKGLQPELKGRKIFVRLCSIAWLEQGVLSSRGRVRRLDFQGSRVNTSDWVQISGASQVLDQSTHHATLQLCPGWNG